MNRNHIRRFWADDRANIAVIFALTLVPIVFLVGMGIDYTNAADRQVQLNAAADAAALAGVTPAMMALPASAAVTAATNTFTAQANRVTGASYSPTGVTVTVSIVNSKRQVLLTYAASSQNAFPNILGQQTIAINGSSQATAGFAPNINFYLLLDSSPSMAIAANQADINKMVANTGSQGGCAFGCHQTNAAVDNLGNPGGVDNYQLARNLGVTLRIDLVRQAAIDLMASATSAMTVNGAVYQMATYTFDVNLNTIGTLTSNLSFASTQAGTVTSLQVYSNNFLTSGNNNNDEDTNYDSAMTGANAVMPQPGLGTKAANDTPQEVLFFVTDGVEDEKVGGNRQQSIMDPAQCTTIKNRGIRIAVLYTTYLPLPTNAWYNSYIKPIQNNIAPALQTCASPGLFYQVQTGGDISAALIGLFQLVVQTAYLSK